MGAWQFSSLDSADLSRRQRRKSIFRIYQSFPHLSRKVLYQVKPRGESSKLGCESCRFPTGKAQSVLVHRVFDVGQRQSKSLTFASQSGYGLIDIATHCGPCSFCDSRIAENLLAPGLCFRTCAMKSFCCSSRVNSRVTRLSGRLGFIVNFGGCYSCHFRLETEPLLLENSFHRNPDRFAMTTSNLAQPARDLSHSIQINEAAFG